MEVEYRRSIIYLDFFSSRKPRNVNWNSPSVGGRGGVRCRSKAIEFSQRYDVSLLVICYDRYTILILYKVTGFEKI